MNALRIAEILDAYRAVPRLLVCLYGFTCWHVTTWFMALPDPTGPQATLVATVWGGAAAWFAVYTNTGRKWQS